jgi:hypothetical protein
MQQDIAQTLHTCLRYVLHTAFTLFIVLSSLWFCSALWIQAPLGRITSSLIMVIWLCFSLCVLGIYFRQHLISRSLDLLLYSMMFALSLVWYFSLDARNDRDWNPEVARMLESTQHGNIIQLQHVRNFDWHPDGGYTEHWENRTLRLDDIQGVNIVTSYWMGPQIAHTLVSFDIKQQRPLTFSIEIRKEKNEEFSAFGGFFRQYELSLIAADEKDIIYTRSNIRGEQVYFFPVTMSQDMAQQLFLEYLSKAKDLKQHPKWYNTLTSNCTTLVFDMVQAVSQKQLPVDYRLIASGYLPNYLNDLHVLPYDWPMSTWYQRAHVNPKTQHYTQLSSEQYSKLLRKNLQSEALK